MPLMTAEEALTEILNQIPEEFRPTLEEIKVQVETALDYAKERTWRITAAANELSVVDLKYSEQFHDLLREDFLKDCVKLLSDYSSSSPKEQLTIILGIKFAHLVAASMTEEKPDVTH